MSALLSESWRDRWLDSDQHRQIWVLAWPMILSNITVPLLGLVDTAVIGHLPDPRYLGAVAIGASLYSVLFWGFGFLRMGTTGVSAKAWGAEDFDVLRLLLIQSLVLALLIGLTLVLLQAPLIEFGLYLLEPGEKVLPLAQLYCQIRIYSAPAVLANYALLGWFLGTQNSRIPLMLLLCANLCNILLDLVLVIGLQMTVDGVAWATLAADYLTLFLGLYFAFRRLGKLPGRLPRTRLFNLSAYRALLVSNRYLFVRTLLLLTCFCFFTRQGAGLGEQILAANAVLLNFLMLISHGLDGFAHAIEALCGKHKGAQDDRRFYSACRAATLWSLGTAAVMTLFFGMAGHRLIALLTDIPEVIRLAADYLPWLIAMPLVAVWSYLLDGIFIGANWFRAMQNCMIVAVLLVFVPSWYISQPWGNHGLWLSLLLLMLARGITTGGYFLLISRR